MLATALLIATPVCAQESIGPEVPAAAVEEKEAGDNYEACAAFRADIDADLREVLKAGCEPTLAQMSALMDNPIGNVAMLFNQVDACRMKEPDSGTTENQCNYMLLAGRSSGTAPDLGAFHLYHASTQLQGSVTDKE